MPVARAPAMAKSCVAPPTAAPAGGRRQTGSATRPVGWSAARTPMPVVWSTAAAPAAATVAPRGTTLAVRPVSFVRTPAETQTSAAPVGRSAVPAGPMAIAAPNAAAMPTAQERRAREGSAAKAKARDRAAATRQTVARGYSALAPPVTIPVSLQNRPVSSSERSANMGATNAAWTTFLPSATRFTPSRTIVPMATTTSAVARPSAPAMSHATAVSISSARVPHAVRARADSAIILTNAAADWRAQTIPASHAPGCSSRAASQSLAVTVPARFVPTEACAYVDRALSIVKPWERVSRGSVAPMPIACRPILA